VNGARQVKTKGKDDIPDWPQPQAWGIYVKGTVFHPVGFLKTPWDMHEKVVVGGEECQSLRGVRGSGFGGKAPEEEDYR